MGRSLYGTRFDARIAAGIRSGTSLAKIAAKLRISEWFVGRRGHALGLSSEIYANGNKARSVGSVGSGCTAKRWRKLAAEVGKSPGDRLLSDVARSLRDRPAELSDIAVAALHERGLTVDELCDGTGRAPWMIVRAVREAARCG